MYSREIDKKWQKIWQDKNIFKYIKDDNKPKYYVLEMFSYPSAAKLHIGHWFNYAPVDTFARFKKMNGYNIFHPMGFDSFGLPAENYAIKTGVHPKDSTEDNIKNMIEQINSIGGTFDFSHTVRTHTPEYYKWTQWLFTELYKKGLAYRKEAPVNWCPSCNTVLANEQVIQGKCERCDSLVERKKLNQWFFKITDYAEELINDLDNLDWPEKTKKIQKNWIGKSEGIALFFKLENPVYIDGEKWEKLEVFTTRIDTIYGITFISVAPESELAKVLITDEYRVEAEKYIKETITKSELERQFTDREKTGVFTGSYVLHPLTNKKIPVFLADYVLEGYATGIVMGVPAHDKRDYDFAKKMNLDIIPVILNEKENVDLEYFKNNSYDKKQGIMVNSDKFNGLTVEQFKDEIIKYLEKNNLGYKKVNYKLKDWLVSRQRYWGAPIPIIYCEHCGEVVLDKENLPVKLPYNVKFKPDGKSPLAKCEEFVNTICPKCGNKAKREVDTLDTFVCSSWYEMRYLTPNDNNQPFDKNILSQMMPVDIYVGGSEHAAMHLIYTRFIKKALRDMGYIDYSEPFKKLVHQGKILGTDGNKMSKSKGNTVNPDDLVEKYGSDTVRMYLMFAFKYSEGGAWQNEGIVAMHKYLKRVEEYFEKIIEDKTNNKINEIETSEIKKLDYNINRVIKAVTNDVENLEFNTAIARLMEMTNEMQKSYLNNGVSNKLLEVSKTFLVLLSIFAPHLADEIYSKLENKEIIYINEAWPKYDESKLVLDEIKLPIQINGKIRDLLYVPADITEEEIKKIISKNEKVQKYLEGKNIIKEIYIKNRIYNIVVK